MAVHDKHPPPTPTHDCKRGACYDHGEKVKTSSPCRYRKVYCHCDNVTLHTQHEDPAVFHAHHQLWSQSVLKSVVERRTFGGSGAGVIFIYPSLGVPGLIAALKSQPCPHTLTQAMAILGSFSLHEVQRLHSQVPRLARPFEAIFQGFLSCSSSLFRQVLTT